MSKIKALLFDLNGALIDSEFFHFELWNEILREHNVCLGYSDWLATYAGTPLPKNAFNLIEKYQINAQLEEVIIRRENLTLERLKTKDVNLMPYACAFLEYFHAKGLTLALVTSSPRKDVEAIFERNGLGKFFSLIITRTEVNKSKPDPESYNICVEKLKVLKEECIVFEDTLTGVKSALAAGITCYAIQSNMNEHEKLKIADKLFLNFDDAKKIIVQNKFFTDYSPTFSVDPTFPSGLPKAILVHDRWAAHFKTEVKDHQICIAHLFREFNYIQQVHQSDWALAFKNLLKSALELSSSSNYNPFEENQTRNQLKKSLDELLLQSLPQHDKLAIRIQKKLRKIIPYILCFLQHNNVPADNNGSERAIRNLKVKQKISGAFRSFRGAFNFAVIRSVIDTTIKSGQNVFVVLNLIAKLQPD